MPDGSPTKADQQNGAASIVSKEPREQLKEIGLTPAQVAGEEEQPTNTETANTSSESNMVRASELYLDEPASDSDSFESDVMSASNLPTYSSGEEHDGSSNGVMSVAETNLYESNEENTHRDVSSESESEKSTRNNPFEDTTTTSGSQAVPKTRSFNFRFKRGALISGVAQEDKNEQDHLSRRDTDEVESPKRSNANLEDVEEGPERGFATRVTRSLWNQTSIESDDLRQKDIASVIDDGEHTAAVMDEKKSAATDDNNEDGWFTKLKSKHFLYTSIVAVVILIIIIAVAVTATKKGSANSGKKEATENARDEPTPAPVSMEEMHSKIHLAVSQIVRADVLSDTVTPESQALSWLLEEDTVWTHRHDDFSVERIQQRFVLVAFYFAMDGPSWHANNWLQGDECSGGDDWTFINCNKDEQVRALSFDNVGLKGQIPSFIAHLPNVENFIIKKESAVSGSIPAEFGHLGKLKQLGLYYTGLSGSIPKEIFLASSLTFVNFQNNNLFGNLPSKISNLDNLETLVLMNNGLSGEIPWDSLAASGASFLGLSNNDFQGEIPSSISNFERLAYLYLDGNVLSGEIPRAIGQVKDLRSVNLDNNILRGRIPETIGGLSDLEFFSAQYNAFTGPLPIEIENMTNLQTIGLGSNRLSGRLPDLERLTGLQNLYLFNNQFTGSIPSGLFGLKALKVLFLSSNIFTGHLLLPGKINSKLIGLYLSDNQLDGKIKPSVCNFRALQALFLDENNFTGRLPGCLGLLRHLTQFHVFKNLLTGFVPHELSSLQELEEIGLEGNHFIGKVPDGLCNAVSERNIEFWSDCGGDDADIACECCSMCCVEPDNCTEQALVAGGL